MPLVPDDHLRLVPLASYGREAPGETVITVPTRKPVRTPAVIVRRPSLIMAAIPSVHASESACKGVTEIMSEDATGVVFVQQDGKRWHWRVTVEKREPGGDA